MHETDPNPTGPSKASSSETDPEFTAALDCFGDAVELIGANLNKRNNHDGDNRLKSLAKLMKIGSPDNLYHYTTAAGIQGIAEKSRFYASAAYYMNDSSEIDYGCEVFANILNASLPKIDQAENSLAVLAQHGVSKAFSNVGSLRNQLLQTYVVCFCEEPNLLSQWRTYGQSGGYSIGLNKDALGHLHTQSDVFSVELKKVIYQKHHQEKILQGVIDDSVQGFENEKIKGKFKDLTPAAKDYCVRMSEFLL